MLGRIPDGVALEDRSLGAVLASGVLHFLSYEELLLSIRKIYDWLDYGGRFFFETSSIFNKNFANFYSTYEANQKKGDACPGLITNAHDYFSHMQSFIPERLMLFSLEEITAILETHNFKIIRAEYFDNINSGEHEELKRDSLGIVAQKCPI